nr:NADH dehydrogenase subunit 5 [Pherusa bengalensis]
MSHNYASTCAKFMWISFILMASISFHLIMNNKHIIMEWTLMVINSTQITIPIIMDPLNTIFSSTVLFISANVLMFSASYMKEDIYMKRFIQLVLAFVMSMNMLIFIPHMITLLLGWDGLGVTSFLLVIYYQNPKSLAAGMITALTNRIGDILILLSIAWSLTQGHWLILQMSLTPTSSMIIMSIMVAAMTKSAQMPFSSWLPAAMAAPTPVSALVHSSTLVTAGVFLLIRFYPFLHTMKMFNYSLLFIATITMLMAGMSAMTETDLKKIIALSTLSQLGVMMAALGMNHPKIALFHLITHALFKALLFICAGSMIHYNHHSQDIRTMGNVLNQMPITTSCLMTANLALIGTPFLAGYYSKDLILELSMYQQMNSLILILFMLATSLTAMYSIRMMIITLWGPSQNYPLSNTNNEDMNLTTPATILAMGAISWGAAMNWMFMTPLIHPTLTWHAINTPLMVTLLGLLLGILYINKKESMMISLPMTNHFLSSMWFMSPLSSQNMMNLPLKLSKLIFKTTDMGWNELYGGQGIHMMSSSLSKNIQPMQAKTINSQLLVSLLLISLMMSITL